MFEPNCSLLRLCGYRCAPPRVRYLKVRSFLTPSATVPLQPDESLLVDKAKAGDQQAFTDLVSRYQRKIYRLAKNITRNDEDAEDVLQEAFLKAYEHLDGFEGNSRFYTWIVRIAVNEALMKLRKRKGDRTVPLD